MVGLQKYNLIHTTMSISIISLETTAKITPYILIGAHYDSRYYSDQDPDPSSRNKPVPGANDGASGVSVLLELARTIPEASRKNVWLVFFDAEDQGRINGWDWIIGSQSFVNQIPVLPQKVIIVDMVGDKDLQLFYESNSDADLQQEIWNIAAESVTIKIYSINNLSTRSLMTISPLQNLESHLSILLILIILIGIPHRI